MWRGTNLFFYWILPNVSSKALEASVRPALTHASLRWPTFIFIHLHSPLVKLRLAHKILLLTYKCLPALAPRGLPDLLEPGAPSQNPKSVSRSPLHMFIILLENGLVGNHFKYSQIVIAAKLTGSIHMIDMVQTFLDVNINVHFLKASLRQNQCF